MTTKTPTVGIIGGTIWGNRGAEAMLVTATGQIRDRFPGAHIIVFSYVPAQDRALIRDETIHVAGARPLDLVLRHFPFALLCWLLGLIRVTLSDWMLPAAVRHLRRCDVLLDVGGIAFADGREKFLPFNILIIWPALLLRVPVVKLAQALGPFENPLNRWASRLFLPRSRRIFARGAITAAHLKAINISPEKYELSADVAFLYRPEYSLSDENEDHVAALENTLSNLRDEGCTLVGIAPSALVYQKSEGKGRDYVGQLLSLIKALDANQHAVLIPNATREGTGLPRNNDLYVIDLIRQRADAELPDDARARLHIVDFDLNTSGSRRLIALCDALITSRFHGMISGLSLGIPTAVIGWSHKYAEVLAEFDLERYVIDFDAADLDIPALLHDLLTAREAVAQQLADSLATVQERARRQFAFVAEDILA